MCHGVALKKKKGSVGERENGVALCHGVALKKMIGRGPREQCRSVPRGGVIFNASFSRELIIRLDVINVFALILNWLARAAVFSLVSECIIVSIHVDWASVTLKMYKLLLFPVCCVRGNFHRAVLQGQRFCYPFVSVLHFPLGGVSIFVDGQHDAFGVLGCPHLYWAKKTLVKIR